MSAAGLRVASGGAEQREAITVYGRLEEGSDLIATSSLSSSDHDRAEVHYAFQWCRRDVRSGKSTKIKGATQPIHRVTAEDLVPVREYHARAVHLRLTLACVLKVRASKASLLFSVAI